MTDQIGRADYLLGADISGVKTATAEAEAEILKSGQRVESDTTSRGYRIGAAIGTGIKVVATASTALFAIAAKGAIDLQNAQADYQAQTGATAAEADKAGKAINAMSGRNIQGIKEIGSALTTVHTNMGLVGDEAEQTTERFLKFARATKQDATGAVIAFDNILDAWGLTAQDATGIMDKLILSHQRYGGSIVENQKALATMAPQLKALNLTIDDGIGLLNLFASTGLDAAGAQKALNAAILNLPAGETLQQFIAHLATVTDDGQRAQEAMKVFGTRAGAGLANAIRPGVDSLKAFEVSATDAAGATVKAADALDSTFSSQVALKIKAIGAAIRDVGPELTGLASGLSILGSFASVLHLDDALKTLAPALAKAALAAGQDAGSALSDGLQSVWSGAGGTVIGNNIATRWENILDPTKSTVIGNTWRKLGSAGSTAYLKTLFAGDAVSAAFGRVMTSGPVTAASDKLGQTLGSKAGRAFSVAFAAAAVIGLVETFSNVTTDIRAQTDDLAKQTGEFAQKATFEELVKARDGVGKQLAALGNDPIADALGLSARKGVEATFSSLDEEIKRRTANTVAAARLMSGTISNEIRGTADQIGKAADDMIGDGTRLQRGLASTFAGVGDHAEAMGKGVILVFANTGSAFFSMKARIAEDATRLKEIISGLREKMVSEAQAMITGYYDPLIAQDQLVVAQDQVAADKRALAATKAGTAERHQAKLTLDQSQQALDQTRANLLASGQLTGKEQKTWLADLKTRYKTATGAAKTYLSGLIAKLKELQGVQGQGIKIDIRMNGSGLSPGSKAEGGVIPSGEWSWTGEKGRELIGPAASARMVIPHNLSESLLNMAAATRVMSPASATTSTTVTTIDQRTFTIPVTVTGVGSDVSAAAARSFSQRIGDGIAEILRDQTRRQPAGARG